MVQECVVTTEHGHSGTSGVTPQEWLEFVDVIERFTDRDGVESLRWRFSGRQQMVARSGSASCLASIQRKPMTTSGSRVSGWRMECRSLGSAISPTALAIPLCLASRRRARRGFLIRGKKCRPAAIRPYASLRWKSNCRSVIECCQCASVGSFNFQFPIRAA